MREIAGAVTAACLCASLVTGLFLAQAAQGQNAGSVSSVETSQDQASKEESGKIEEVIVTASKRTETIKDVPGAVTAITSAEVQNLGIVNFEDYRPYVPGLSANIGNGASTDTVAAPGNSTVILRGLYAGPGQTTPTAGYYIGNTPITPSSSASFFGQFAPDPDLGEVERIEVLKGPQSTLYGASTLGGLIKIVPKQPDLTSFSTQFSVGGTALSGDLGYTTRAAANIPLITDVLAVRLSGYDREDPGYTDNVNASARESNSNLDHAFGGSIQVRFDPIEKLDITLSGMNQNLRGEGYTQTDLQIPTLAPGQTDLPQDLAPKYGYGKYSNFYNVQSSTELTVFSLDATYDTGIGTLLNSAGFSRYNARYSNQDQSYNDFLLPIFGETNPNATIVDDGFLESKKATEELRFTSTRLQNFEAQFGVFYTHEDVAFLGSTPLYNGFGGPPLSTGPSSEFFFGGTTATYTEYAAFGDLTYYITDALDVTVGTRYSRNYQDQVLNLQGLLGGGAAAGPPVSTEFNASDESYLFNLRWRPTASLSTYLRAASAYRPGGPQLLPKTDLFAGVPASYGPDTDWCYEVGTKGRWLDGALNANLDVYYIDWRKVQVGAIVSEFSVTLNGGDATSKGVEFDGSYAPIDGLTFGANASYDEARLNSIAANNTAGAVAGDPLPLVPEWTAGITGDYKVLVAPGVTGGVGASWLYQGLRYGSYSEVDYEPRPVIPAYSTVALRAHVDWKQYSLALHVDNLTDKQAYSSIFYYSSGALEGVPIRPRQFRLTLNARFGSSP